MNEQMNLELNLTNIIHHLSPSPPSWSGWSCQCSWWSPLWSQSQNLCCLTFWYDFLKVNKANSTITSINLLSLSVFMAKSIMIAKPKSMLYDLLVWFSEGLQPFVRLLSLILSRFVTLSLTNEHTHTNIRTYRAAVAAKNSKLRAISIVALLHLLTLSESYLLEHN